MGKRSNLILILGVAVFVVGAAATFLVVRSDGGSTTTATAGANSVLTATKPIPAGTTGSSAIEQGLVKLKGMSPGAIPVGAVVDPSLLVGKTATSAIAEGAVVTNDNFSVPQTHLGTVKIPAGKTALAVQLESVPAVNGFVGTGDHVDVYGMIKPETQPGGAARLILQNTEVLSVSGQGNANSASATSSSGTNVGPVFLLAVTPQEAEKLAYFSSFQKLYFSLNPKDAGSVPTTPGISSADALKPLA